MMGWLRNNNPVLERKAKVQPGATFSLLENHWKQAMEVMEGPVESPSEAALIVISHLNQMITFLLVAQTEDPEQNCKHFWIRNRCSDKVIKWLHILQIQGLQLMYEDERKLVQTLQSLCEIAKKDGELLGYVTIGPEPCSSSSSTWDGACSLSSLLLEYSLKSDPYLGEPARNSFIHLIQLASKYPQLEQTFSQETGLGLTNVVISGLSACFAQLPTFTPANSDQLEPFITQLLFVDAVTHAAPQKVSSTIADCFKNAFLQAVILPALTQSLHEEIAVVTSYLKIVCEYLTHPQLIKNLLLFVTSSSNLLKVFVQRMNHPNTAVTVSTLGLISVLLEFYCEDFWYNLVLQYLMPQNHLIVSQRFVPPPEIDYQEASVRFLSLIPAQVLDTMGPEAITFHYTQYLTNELSRWSSFDEITFSLMTPPLSPDEIKKSTNNPVFPFWKFRYDGTDQTKQEQAEIKELSKDREVYQGGNVEAVENNSKTEREDIEETLRDPLTSSPKTIKEEEKALLEQNQKPFTTIPLQASLSLDEQINSLGISELSLTNDHEDHINMNLSDGYGSLESNTGQLESSASFGPFLDILLLHLNHLSQLPPDVILMVTDIISILASSRIPLIRSILLDSNLILQPSYTPFTLVLNRIRVEMENYLRGYLPIVNEVWSTMCKKNNCQNLANKSPRDSLVSSFSNTFDATTDNLMKRISNSSSFSSMLNTVLQRKSGVGVGESTVQSSGGPSSPSSGFNNNDLVQSVGNQSYRYIQSQTGSPGQSQNNNQSLEATKLMATRAIFFSHWLLELGAISQQLCWKRPML